MNVCVSSPPHHPKSHTDIMFVCSSVAIATIVSVGRGGASGAIHRSVSRPFSVCVTVSWPLTPPPFQLWGAKTQSSCSATINVSGLYCPGRLFFHHLRHSHHIASHGKMPLSKDNGYFSSWTPAHIPTVATVISSQLQAGHNLEWSKSAEPAPPNPTTPSLCLSVCLHGDGSFWEMVAHSEVWSI